MSKITRNTGLKSIPRTLFPARRDLKKDDEANTDRNRDVRDIERRPVMTPIIKIKKVHNASIEKPVVNVAERASENERQCERPCIAHCVPYQYIYQDEGNKDGNYQEDISCIATLIENAEDTAKISHVHY